MVVAVVYAQVLGSLQLLLLLRPNTLQQVCGQVACALHELLRTSATCLQAPSDWATLFLLMACAGAGLRPQQAPTLQRPPSFHRSMTSVAESTTTSGEPQNGAC